MPLLPLRAERMSATPAAAWSMRTKSATVTSTPSPVSAGPSTPGDAPASNRGAAP